MRQALLALILTVWLGSFISCKRPVSASSAATPHSAKAKPTVRRIGQPSVEPNPFDRYLTNTKRNWPEPAFVIFAQSCGIDLDSSVPRFAQRPDKKWIVVHDLSRALKDQETDFYGTLALWHQGDRMVVEQWGMELDTGDYYRLFYCLENQKITNVESTSWELELQNESSKDTGWGYVHSWSLDKSGKFATVSRGFVDLMEKPISAPQIDAETQQGLNEEGVGMRTLADLEIPRQMVE
jgi:hypothetical protein